MDDSSGEAFLLGLYDAMFSDIVAQCPSLRVDCERDYKRLLSIVETDGYQRLFFDYLPAMGKHFDMCLSQGHLTKSGLPHTRSTNWSSTIPRLFKGLYLLVFDKSGELRAGLDPQAVMWLRQLFYCCKRYRTDCDPTYTFRSVDEFFQTDREVSPGSLNWDGDDFSTDTISDLHIGDRFSTVLLPDDLLRETYGSTSPLLDSNCADAIQFVADVVTAEVGGFNAYDWRARHGPGAVADAKGVADKYLFPSWPAKLDAVFPYADWAFSSHGVWADSVIHEGSSLSSDNEVPAKLIAVPKEFTKPRLIASEPTAHQWCQQVIRDFLMDRVQETSIRHTVNFRSQERNARLALLASHTGSHGTIDLSSASDRISCYVVERLFRRSPTLVTAFHSVRTRWIRNDIDKKSPKLERLRKFSTMGSALTFPVQTYLFSMIAIGCLLSVRKLPWSSSSIERLSREVRVFGDDIIVPSDVMDLVQETLCTLGLRVNRNKTYGTGKFRESCGCEAYDGHDVTRISVNTTPVVSKPESVVSSVDTHNNFLMKGYVRTADYLKRRVVSWKRYFFPLTRPGSGSVGWYDIAWWDRSSLRKRWNPSLQRVEYRVTRAYARSRTVPTRGVSMLLQYFTVGCREVEFLVRELGLLASTTELKLRLRWEPEVNLIN